ncbi:MAG: lytic transglycosylase domain-containing protein [Deltaproteobacteria bacterium]|nr:lytic transglycosylase domain-containing protein [Deltaproteobacteria bacterium]
MKRNTLRISIAFFLALTGFFSPPDTATADIRVYRNAKGVLYITNTSVAAVAARKSSKGGKVAKIRSAPFSGGLINVSKELGERNFSEPPPPDRFVHDPATKSAIHVYRNKHGALLFTNVPNRPGYRPFLLLNTYARRLSGRDSAAFDRLIRAACQWYGVEFALVKAVMKAESSFNPQALSHAGARGLMQLMPATAAMHGVEDIHAPSDNIDGGVRHLRLLLNQFDGDVTLAVAAYNAGAGAVTRYNGIPPYQETQQYVRRVLQYRDSYRART